MPLLPVYEWAGLDLTRRQKWLVNAVGAVLIGFVLIDWGVIHPQVWMNDPAIGYWLAKPVWVGIPMLAVAWWLFSRDDRSITASILLGAFAGIVSLQAYYTFIPIPIEGGPSIQIGLVGNFSEGLIVHFGGIAIAAVFVVATIGWWKQRG